MTLQTMSTWIAVTKEALADAQVIGPWITAWLEYSLSDASDAPFTWIERLTGTRLWTSSTGYVLHVAVGWRRDLREVLGQFARDAWPEDYPPDDEEDE